MTRRNAVRAISFLWLGSLAGAGCAFLTQVVLARVLGPNTFGIFASALATVTLLVPLAGFGVAPFWLKVFGEEGWQARRWWPGSFRFVCVSTLVVLISLALWAGFGPHGALMQSALFLMLVYVLGQVVLELVSSKFQLEEQYALLAIWQFLPHFLRLVFVALGAWWFNQTFGLLEAVSVYTVISLILFLAGAWILVRMHKGDFFLAGHVTKKIDDKSTTKAIAP